MDELDPLTRNFPVDADGFIRPATAYRVGTGASPE